MYFDVVDLIPDEGINLPDLSGAILSMRIIVAIICFMAFINGANASISTAMHGNGQQQADNTHINKTHNHNQQAHLADHTGGKCHTGCKMHSATPIRRNDDTILISNYKPSLEILSFIDILQRLFENSSLNNSDSLLNYKLVDILPVYALTQRFRI